MRTPTGTIIEHAVLALRFIQQRRGEFTVSEMSRAMGLAKPSGAYRYLTELSRHFPIVEVAPYRKGGGFARGAVAARYRIDTP